MNDMTYAPYPDLALYIDGEFIGAGDRDGEDVINPADKSKLGILPHATRQDLDRALDAGGLPLHAHQESVQGEVHRQGALPTTTSTTEPVRRSQRPSTSRWSVRD